MIPNDREDPGFVKFMSSGGRGFREKGSNNEFCFLFEHSAVMSCDSFCHLGRWAFY